MHVNIRRCAVAVAALALLSSAPVATQSVKRPQKQYRLDGSKFLDVGRINNELKFGFGYRDTPVGS